MPRPASSDPDPSLGSDPSQADGPIDTPASASAPSAASTPDTPADPERARARAGDGYFGPSGDAPVDQRLSTLAVASLLGVLASIVLGCGGLLGTLSGINTGWAVFAGPVLGLVASAAAFIALRRILTSKGRLMGRFAATLALFVGLGVTTLTGFTAIAAALTLSASKSLAPIVADTSIGAQQGRAVLATRGLNEAARRELDDAALARFGALLQRELGTVTGASADIELMVEARRVMAQSPGAAYVDAGDLDLADAPRPVWIEYTSADGTASRALAYVRYDLFDREAELADAQAQADQEAEDGGAAQDTGVPTDARGEPLPPGDGGEGGVRPFTEAREAQVIVSDIAVFVGPNRVVLLREDGPAARIAELLGWEVVRE